RGAHARQRLRARLARGDQSADPTALEGIRLRGHLALSADGGSGRGRGAELGRDFAPSEGREIDRGGGRAAARAGAVRRIAVEALARGPVGLLRNPLGGVPLDARELAAALLAVPRDALPSGLARLVANLDRF